MKKLRNKETGEIGRLSVDIDKPDNGIRVYYEDGVTYRMYNSLAELNEEWEDYEEDELFYVISAEHKSGYQCVLKEDYPEICKVAKELGIRFETEKEAKKAVEKLKAWKRLKDKGIEFTSWGYGVQNLYVKIRFNKTSWATETEPDLDLLFGGEE